MSHTTTRKTLRQNIIKRLYRPRYPIVSVTTDISADAGEIVDTALVGGDVFARGMRDAYVYIVEQVDSPATGPTYGEAKKLLGLESSAIWPVLTDFDQKPNTGTDYEIHYKFHPDVINDKIDRLLEELRVPTLIPLSILRNPDFSVTTSTRTVPTHWTLGANLAMLREVQDAVEEEDFLFFGPNINKFTASGADKDLTTVFPTVPGKTYYVTVPILSSDGDKVTVTLESPASTVIETGSTSWGFSTDTFQHSVVHFAVTIPADQYSATLRIACENTDTVYYIPHVLVTPVGADQFNTPIHRDISLRDSQVITFPIGNIIEATDSAKNYMWLEGQPKLFSHTKQFPGFHGGLRRISLETKATGVPMYLLGEESFPAFEADANETAAEKDAAVTWAPAKLIEYLAVQELLEEWAEAEDEQGNEIASARLYSRAKNIKAEKVMPESRRIFSDVQAIIQGAL